jgi:FeS assembly protein IscX
VRAVPDKLTWTDAEEIALRLMDTHADVHPLGIRFTDLHAWVCELDEFDDATEASTEAKLEAIQMAWLEEYEEVHE